MVTKTTPNAYVYKRGRGAWGAYRLVKSLSSLEVAYAYAFTLASQAALGKHEVRKITLSDGERHYCSDKHERSAFIVLPYALTADELKRM